MLQRLISAVLALALSGSSAAFLQCQLRCVDPGQLHGSEVAGDSAHAPCHGDSEAPDRALASGAVLCQHPAVLAAANDRYAAGNDDAIVLPRVALLEWPISTAARVPVLPSVELAPHPPTSLPLRI